MEPVVVGIWHVVGIAELAAIDLTVTTEFARRDLVPTRQRTGGTRRTVSRIAAVTVIRALVTLLFAHVNIAITTDVGGTLIGAGIAAVHVAVVTSFARINRAVTTSTNLCTSDVEPVCNRVITASTGRIITDHHTGHAHRTGRTITDTLPSASSASAFVIGRTRLVVVLSW